MIGPHSAPTKLGPGRVFTMSCAAFDTNTSLAVERTLVVKLDQERPPNQIMYVLIDTRAVLDSGGKPFVVKGVLRLPLWSSSLSPGSLLAEVFLSVLPFEVEANRRRCSGARADKFPTSTWYCHQDNGYGSITDQFLPAAQGLERKWRVQALQRLLDLTTMDGASVFILSVIFQEVGVLHLAFDTDVLMLSDTSGVAFVSQAIFSVIALHSEKPIEDLLFPDDGSTSDISSCTSFCFT